MKTRKKIFAISGSTRSGSVNMHVLQAVAELYRDQLDTTIFEGIDQLPHFNPDLDKEPFPPTVTAFRAQIEAADGILVCTPEYVYSLPGSLKNAVEWLVSTTLLTDKPTALITAASSGRKAQEALDQLMGILGVKLASPGSLLITAPKTKIDADGVLTDDSTREELRRLIDAFIAMLVSADTL